MKNNPVGVVRERLVIPVIFRIINKARNTVILTMNFLKRIYATVSSKFIKSQAMPDQNKDDMEMNIFTVGERHAVPQMEYKMV